MTTWNEAITQYLETKMATNSFSESTITNRRFVLFDLAKFAEQHKVFCPTKAHKNLILQFFSQKKVSNNSKRSIYYALLNFFDFLMEEEELPENIVTLVNAPKDRYIESDFLDEEEIRLFFEGIISSSKEFTMNRNLLIAAILCSLCIRVSEVAGLKVTDVNTTQKTIRILRKGGAEILLPINEDLLDYFNAWMDSRQQWRGAESKWLFLSSRGDRLSKRSFQSICRAGIEKAGLVKRKMGPHLLRHSGASIYLANGVDVKTVQTLLGHSNVSTTSRYIHASKGRLEQAVSKFPLPGVLG